MTDYDAIDGVTQLAAHLSTLTIPQLVEGVAAGEDEEARRIYYRELHRRGVSITGLIPRNHAPERTTGVLINTRRASVVDPRPEF